MRKSTVLYLRAEWTRWKPHGISGAPASRRHAKPRVESLERRALLASITEYPIPAGSPALGNGLFGITGGPDGNVYFTDTLNNAIGQITPAGLITELPLPTSGGGFFKNGLDGIALGSNNKLMFTESTQGRLGAMTTTGSYNPVPIDSTGKNTGQEPDQITASRDGTLWFTEDAAEAIGELTPSGVFSQYPVSGATNGGILGPSMKGITVGPDGNIWFTNWGSSGDFIGMMTPAGNVTEYPLSFGTDPVGITSGPDGNLWFTAYGSNTIDVMSTSGTLLHQYSIIPPGGTGGPGSLAGITLGSDDNFYYAEQTGYIGEMTVDGTPTNYPVSTTVTTIPGASGPQPLAIASGPDGNIWFTDPWTASIGVLRIAPSPTPTPTPTSSPTPVTMYDATQITGVSNGSPVTTLTDLSGNGNNAIESSSAAAVGAYVTNGIGGLPSIQFTRSGSITGDGTGYQSVLNMGTAFGISGDAAWTAIYVFRAAAPPLGDYSWVGSLGAGSIAHAGALIELDAVHPINGQTPHLDLATGFSNDAVLEPGNSYEQLAGKDLVLTVIHQGPGAGSIGNTIQEFVDGESPGQGILSGLSLGTTGDAATAALDLANEPFFLGGSPFGTGAGFNGLLSEALVYNTALTTADRNVIESQLMTKFGIAPVPEPTSSTTMLRASTSESVYGQPITLTATVTNPTETPTGSVTFYDGSADLGTSSLVNGTATLIVSTLPVGTDSLTASYAGNSQFGQSQSPSLSTIVQKDGTSVVITSAPNPSEFGQAVAFTAIVSPRTPGGGSPTGTVEFLDGGAVLGTVILNGTVATFTTNALSPGSNAITAVYSGDGDFLGQTSAALSQIVRPSSLSNLTTMKLTAKPRLATLGRLVTLSATVKTLIPRGGTPGGSVTFVDGSVSLGTVVLRRGKAILKTSNLHGGPNLIEAEYEPSPGFAPSNTSIVENVRVPRSLKKAVVSARTTSRAVLSTAMAAGVGESGAISEGTVMILRGPTVMGPLGRVRGGTSIRDGAGR